MNVLPAIPGVFGPAERFVEQLAIMRLTSGVCCVAAACAAFMVSSTSQAGDDEWGTPVVRLAMGPAVHVHPPEEAQTYYALDITAGVKGGSDMLVLGAELGYSFDAIDTHAFNFTTGFGIGTPVVGVTLQPRLLAGRGGGTALIGMRNGVMGYLFYDMFTVEVGHQFTHYGEQDVGLHHDVHLMFGFNPAAFVGVVSSLVKAFR